MPKSNAGSLLACVDSRLLPSSSAHGPGKRLSWMSAPVLELVGLSWSLMLPHSHAPTKSASELSLMHCIAQRARAHACTPKHTSTTIADWTDSNTDTLYSLFAAAVNSERPGQTFLADGRHCTAAGMRGAACPLAVGTHVPPLLRRKMVMVQGRRRRIGRRRQVPQRRPQRQGAAARRRSCSASVHGFSCTP